MTTIYERVAKKTGKTVAEVIAGLNAAAEKAAKNSLKNNACFSFVYGQRRKKLSPSFEVCEVAGLVTRQVKSPFLSTISRKFRFCGPCDRARRKFLAEFRSALREKAKWEGL